jgi:hypothetical protein
MTRPALGGRRLVTFAVVCVAALSGAVMYVSRARMRTGTIVSAVTRIQVSDAQRLSVIRRGNHLLFRDMTAGPSYGALAFASLDDQGERVSTGLPCARLHASRNRAVCLAVEQRPSIGHRAYVLQDLDHHPEVVRALDLPGLPSRVRVSGDGRLAAYTVFVAGDSYLSAGFSTRTRLLDLETGRELGDLEQRHVTKGQSRFQAVDQNFWGITFAPDASRFFATLGTGGKLFLVMGEPASRGLVVLDEGIECPSLSPDGTRIAFKHTRAGSAPPHWQPAVLELSTRRVTLLPEARSVDDQIEWLDDDHVLYGLRGPQAIQPRRADIWRLSADGRGAPALLLADAESPAVLRR